MAMHEVDEVEEDDNPSNEDEFVNKFKQVILKDPIQTIADEEARRVFDRMRNESNIMVAKSTLDPWLTDAVDSDEFVSFFTKHIQLLCDTNRADYLSKPNKRPVANFIKLQMLVWNISDRLESFCIKLNESKVQNYLFNLLKKPQLHPSVCLIEINARLLVHTSIGILHNLSNHIPQIRASYRKLGAVRVLTPYANGGEMDVLRPDGQENRPKTPNSILYLSLRTAALLLLAFLVDEKESQILNATDVHIVYLLTALKDALNYSSHLSSATYGFRATELLNGLQHLAGPDRNKRTLINNGAMKVIETTLTIATEIKFPYEEQDTMNTASSLVSPDGLACATLEFLWALSFVPESHQALASGSDFRRSLESFSTEPWSKECQCVAENIRWNLERSYNQTSGEIMPIDRMMAQERAQPNKFGHLMISYQHSAMPIMLRVRDALCKRGYTVWMDVDYQRGSFVDNMAEGIEQASALILGISQSFKNSPHCRQEVKYAYQLHIPLYPLQLEDNFVPDGWLGLLLATIIYITLTDESMVDVAVEQLVAQLGDTGRCAPTPLLNAIDAGDLLRSGSFVASVSSHSELSPFEMLPKDKCIVPSSGQACFIRHFREGSTPASEPLTPGGSNSAGPRTEDEKELTAATFYSSPRASWRDFLLSSCCISDHVSAWSTQDVCKWLTDNGLSKYSDSLSEVDGPMLVELARLRLVAPESLANSLHRDFGMGLVDQLRLYRALADLSLKSEAPP
ncbi:unnamed protein product [Calicophoron daubneyi]|uniref:ADP-ribosyl cyclase/cyclic ADP-ribose hydrolase n=1 Tax=Calicophoron daubneyi TaxID=300641 RepID=A0AAV2T1L4_CALDB